MSSKSFLRPRLKNLSVVKVHLFMSFCFLSLSTSDSSVSFLPRSSFSRKVRLILRLKLLNESASEDSNDNDSVESFSLILVFIRKIVDCLRFGFAYLKLSEKFCKLSPFSLKSESVSRLFSSPSIVSSLFDCLGIKSFIFLPDVWLYSRSLGG
jgi:hypothetical protein